MIQAKGIEKSFGALKVLKGVDLSVSKAEVVSIMGASGAGKSTLLQILGSLSTPDAGSLVIDGIDVLKLGSKALAEFRNRKLGFVFQFHHLLPEFTALENVMIPAFIAGRSRKDAQAEATALLADLGLAERLGHKPSELSGGEQQRVALARALVNQADIIVADEPTGNIDPEMSKEIVDLLTHINRNKNTTVIMVTHAVDLVKQYNKRIITIKNGSVFSDTAHPEIVGVDFGIPEKTAPKAYYEAPLEDAEIENFLDSYGVSSKANIEDFVSDDE